ncbi:hypothetical protein OIE66_00370 [Nonomuraea sp. NBC_01738]|uniref:hypothetical protein n=1 Tax=Nonomuraea sp. NBC_01738 TaxID=2976003 RepID=UPI002E0E0BD6|nr:hypothetical protein OIE66_00370 [Nonomuraea sp. NBC_01738]
MNTLNTPATERVEAFYTATKKLGRWTEARDLDLRARRGFAVLDLRGIDGDVELHLDTERSAVKLLVPEHAVIDQRDLHVAGRRSRVKDWHRPEQQTGPRIHLTGAIRDGELRVHRGGVAILSAMFSRDFLTDCRDAHRTGAPLTVLDPSTPYGMPGKAHPPTA